MPLLFFEGILSQKKTGQEFREAAHLFEVVLMSSLAPSSVASTSQIYSSSQTERSIAHYMQEHSKKGLIRFPYLGYQGATDMSFRDCATSKISEGSKTLFRIGTRLSPGIPH